MVMDPHLAEFSDSVNGFKFEDDDTFLPNLYQSENLANTFQLKDDSLDVNFMDLPSVSPSPDPGSIAPNPNRISEVDSPGDSDSSSDIFLKFVNSILMEENLEQKPSMFHDPLALKATEKSLYDVIGKKYPASPYQPPLYFNKDIENSDDYLFGSHGWSEQSTSSSTSGGNFVDSQWVIDSGGHKPSAQSYPFESTFQTTTKRSFGSMNSLSGGVNGPMDSSMSTHLVSNIFSDSHSILQFNRGVDEASKFLPSNNQLIVDLESYALPPESKQGVSEVVVEVKKDERGGLPNGPRGRKNLHREDGNLEEERNSKQSALYAEEDEFSELFDRVLLSTDPCCHVAEVKSKVTNNPQQNGQSHGSNGGKSHAKKSGNRMEGVVDLRTLLINCAQSVATDDRKSAKEQLNQIWQHSSSTGDGSQRLAEIFAKGLLARLAGTGSQIYAALASRRISAVQKLKAYQLFLSACPFKYMAVAFANKTIVDLVANSAKKKLHIIDFGILYGFQWPILIQHLSNPSGETPELRITGIEFPRPGFRPAELVEETGRRLAKYCERFNVPFQYHAIAQNWETIKIEDLNINSDEVLVVNCLARFKNLLDETVVLDCPRDAVLKLIRKMNPDAFIHSVINGSYNVPFFVTRFREALYHYSTLFDVLDTNIPRDNPIRMNFEQEFAGREIMNVIACEGLERVERPETYKQWHVRNIRAGLKILPLNQELLKKLRGKLKAAYHKDFVIDEDGQWMLQGLKGRVCIASSCWAPA